jgi:hypothetical protein
LFSGCGPSLEDQLRMREDGGAVDGGSDGNGTVIVSPPPTYGQPQAAPVDPNPTAPLGANGAALGWSNAPALGDVQFVPNRDSVQLRLPTVSGAVDYRAILLGDGAGVTTGSDGTERVTGTTIVCAGYLQRNTRHTDRELLSEIEVPGLSAATRVVIEAIDTPCPFVGVVGATHDDLQRNAIPGNDIVAKDVGTYHVFTESDVVQTFGASILNGQGPSTTQTGQPAAATAPKVLARTTVTVTPSGSSAAPPVSSFFDDFSTPDPPVKISDGTTCYPSQGCNHPYVDVWQNKKWTFEPAGTDKMQYLYDRGQLHTIIADGGAVGFSSAMAYPRQLAHVDDTNYLHVHYEVDSLTTSRRYWWIAICGADQAGQTIAADGTPLSFLHPDSGLQNGTNNNPNLSGFGCVMLFPKEGNIIFPLPLGDGTQAPPETQARVFVYKSGTGATGVNVNPDQYKNGWIDPSWFREMDGAGKLVGPMFDENNLYHVATHFDLYLRRGRIVLYADGKQKLCNDFAPSMMTMSEAMVGFGQVLYHTSAEQAELVEDPGTGGVTPPGVRMAYENLKFFDRRTWDNLGFDDGVGAPSNFDESTCYRSAK